MIAAESAEMKGGRKGATLLQRSRGVIAAESITKLPTGTAARCFNGAAA